MLEGCCGTQGSRRPEAGTDAFWWMPGVGALMSREGTSSIGIAALSPHAGESGMFGQREIDEIVPSVGAARAAGVDARGSFPADTIS